MAVSPGMLSKTFVRVLISSSWIIYFYLILLSVPCVEFSGKILLLLATLHQNIWLDTHSSQQNSPKLITKLQVVTWNAVFLFFLKIS